MALRPDMRIAISIAAVILLLAIGAFAQQSAREIYERAQLLDESNQNLTEAIRLYNQVIAQAKDQRALAARSQYRIGLLYNRLGRRAEAQRAFRTVVSQYPDQADVARRAQALIAGANGRQEENALVKQTGPSADGWYEATFTSLTEQDFGRPAIDSARHRLYVIAHNYHEPRNEVERRRVERQGLRYVYEPSVLIVIDTDTNSIIRTIRLSIYIDEIAFNPASNKLYATAQIDGHIKVIDADTFTQTKIPVRGQPTNIAVNAATNKIYVTSQGFAGNDKLFVIDGANGVMSGPYDLDGVAGRLVVNPATNRIYAFASPKTRVFNGEDNSVLTDLPAIGVIGADPAHNLIYAAAMGADNNIQSLDGNNHSLVATFESSRLASIGIASDINRLWAALPDKNQIALIDTITHTETGRLLVAETPVFLAVDQSRGHAYVCHAGNPAMIGVIAGRNLRGEIPEELFDQFNLATLDSAWTVAPGQGGYSLADGHLRLRLAGPSGSKPRLLSRKFRGDHWRLDVKVSYSTGASGGGRSAVLGLTFGAVPMAGSFGKPSGMPVNAIYIFRTRDDWNGCCPGEIQSYFVENGKAVSVNTLTPTPADAYVWRIRRNGRMITIERSNDGIDFMPFGSHAFGAQIDGVVQFFGISHDSFANNDAYADFDYVRLSQTPSRQPSTANTKLKR
ncbi:MAG: tetratricopeptide repeat protein [Acidobacteriota bacterium]